MPGFNAAGLRTGDKVKILAGYFKDEEGVVQTCDGDGRAVVEIQRGEGAFKARFTAAQIERAIDRPREDEPAGDPVGENRPDEGEPAGESDQA